VKAHLLVTVTKNPKKKNKKNKKMKNRLLRQKVVKTMLQNKKLMWKNRNRN